MHRKELRTQRRRERLERERAAAARQRRQRRITVIGSAFAALAVLFVAVMAIAGASPGGTSDGLADGPAPWPAAAAHLRARLATLAFPPNGDESYHIHALLHVYVDGQPVSVPADVGISAAARIESPLHTHDTSGVIHIEAGAPHDFTLADFFTVWGVAFSGGQLGGYRDGGERTVQLYVNGKRVADVMGYVIYARDNIVVAYGAPGSFPTQPPADALEGL